MLFRYQRLHTLTFNIALLYSEWYNDRNNNTTISHYLCILFRWSSLLADLWYENGLLMLTMIMKFETNISWRESMYLKPSPSDILSSAAIFNICICDEINCNQICWQFSNHVFVLMNKYAPVTPTFNFWCNIFNYAPAKYTFATYNFFFFFLQLNAFKLLCS